VKGGPKLFEKGQSGNPSGYSKERREVNKALAEALRAYEPKAIATPRVCHALGARSSASHHRHQAAPVPGRSGMKELTHG
jgi:hypothetical protein